MLKLEQVSKVYKGGKKAVNSIDLDIAKGEFICFISGRLRKNDDDEDDQQTDRTIVWKDLYRRRKYYGTGPG